jgi:hypothetical protein
MTVGLVQSVGGHENRLGALFLHASAISKPDNPLKRKTPNLVPN